MITTEKPAAGTANLKWTSDLGFRLDFTGVSDEMSVAIGAIPVPADGTIELCGEPLELDKLDLLFKAEVDVGGLPGQVHEAQIAFNSKMAKLNCVVEEVESGELIDFECEAAIAIPKEAPEAGGPKPIPADDEDLDWEDDDTLEAMLGDDTAMLQDPAFAITPVGKESEDTATAPASGKGKGLDALLKALLNADGGEGNFEEPPEDAAPEPLPSDQIIDSPVEDGPTLDPANAHGLLGLMVQAGDLELEDGFSVDDLVSGAAPIVAGMKPPGLKAAALSNWLFQQDAVAELYMDDESLASLLEQW